MPPCPKCGKEVEEGSYFCKFCGAAVPASMPKGGAATSELRGIVERRLNAIRTRDEGILEDVVEESTYTKFDDWPPFTLQNSKMALENERGAYKVMRKYDYEIKDYWENILDDSAVVGFYIHYFGTIRDRDFDVNSRVTLVLKKHDKSWKVVHEHWSRFPEERPQRRGLFG